MFGKAQRHIVPWCVLAAPAFGGIEFTSTSLNIGGLPDAFVATTAVIADVKQTDGQALVLGGTWLDAEAKRWGMLVIALGTQWHVVDTVAFGEAPVLNQRAVTGISALVPFDLDNDGRQALLVVGGLGTSEHFILDWRNGSWQRDQAPFFGLIRPVVVPLDYDGDGWVDLYVSGAEQIEGRPQQIKELAGVMYRNERGRLVLARGVAFPPDIVVDSAHVIDVNEDGRPDLFLCASSPYTMRPFCNRILLNRGGSFQELALPFEGSDKLLGLGSARIGTGDLDGDGMKEILISGIWSERVGPKAFLTLLYRKKHCAAQRKWYLEYDSARMEQIPNIFGDLVLEDLDGDGDIDIFLAGRGTDFQYRIMCFENADGSLRLVEAIDAERLLGDVFDWIVIPWDKDGDGLLDLIAFPKGGSGASKLLLNTSREKPSPPD